MVLKDKSREKGIVGSTEYINVAGIKDIPAKIDTGADSSSIWASHILVTEDGFLHFCLFDEDSPFYTGEVYKRKNFKVVIVRNSFGHEQIRYRTHINVTIKDRKIKAFFNLSDRSRNTFPVLIGRRTISGKFLVDVSKNHTAISAKKTKTKLAQIRFQKNPYKFHCDYVKDSDGKIDNIKLNKKGV